MMYWNINEAGNTSPSLPSGANILNDLADVAIAAPVAGQIIKYDGSTFVNGANNIDASQVTSGTLDYARLPPLNISEGVTPPFISSISPIIPTGDQTIEILGSGFLPATNLSIPGVSINSLSIASPTKIIANISKSGLTGEVPVVLSNGGNTNLIWSDSIKSKKVGDPFADQVVAFLKGDLIDQSIPPNTYTISGSIAVSIDQYRYAPSSFHFQNGIISSSASPNLAVATSDYTAEAWIRPDSVAGGNWRGIMIIGPLSSDGLYLYNSQIQFYQGGTRLTHPAIVAVNQWHHIALQRRNGITSLFVNGVESAPTNFVYNFTSSTVVFGCARFASEIFTGFASHFRLSKVARYAGNFDPNDDPTTYLNM